MSDAEFDPLATLEDNLKKREEVATRAMAVRRAYWHVFSQERMDREAQLVFDDLRKFCGYDADCFDREFPHNTSYMAGARRVFLRIMSMREMQKGDTDGE
jgi:hypothetical protein